jgi:hypothetical protein
MLDALGTDASLHRDLRDAVRELESQPDRSPATAVRLGVCQYLLGRASHAIETLRAADGGALALFHQALAHLATGAHDAAQNCFEAAKKAGYDAAACTAGIARSPLLVLVGSQDRRFLHTGPILHGPLEQMVRHVDHLVAHLGIEGVAIGSDFDGAMIPAGIKDVAGLPNLVGALRAGGYDDDALRRLCVENWLSVLGRTWGG